MLISRPVENLYSVHARRIERNDSARARFDGRRIVVVDVVVFVQFGLDGITVALRQDLPTAGHAQNHQTQDARYQEEHESHFHGNARLPSTTRLCSKSPFASTASSSSHTFPYDKQLFFYLLRHNSGYRV